MKKISTRKLFEELENRKKRTLSLKGIGKIVVLKDYSFKWKGDILCLLCNGEEIHRFSRAVTAQEIEEYILNHKVLRDYCMAPMSACCRFKNCSECNANYKKQALKRKEKKKKIEKPGIDDVPNVKGLFGFPRTQERFLKTRFARKWQ